MMITLKHNIKIAIRFIINDYKYSLFNIFSLAIALSCSLFLIFWIKYELSYESCYPNADKIYRVLEIEEQNTGKHYADFIYNVHNDLKNRFPQIVAATSVHHETLPFSVVGQENKVALRIDYAVASTDYIKIFAFDYIEGSPQTVAKNYGTIITKKTAQKFFGNESPIGKSLTFGESLTVTIDAVIDLPQNTDITFDLLDLSREDVRGKHFIMLGDKNQMTPEFEAQITSFLPSIKDTKNVLKLQKIEDIHLHSPAELKVSSMVQIIIYSIAACLILIVTVVGYVNSSIARSMNRLKEVGVRKVYGSKRNQIIIRFLFEYAIISLLAILIGLVITKLYFPYFSRILGKSLTFSFDFYTVLLLVIVWLLVTSLSGCYSAFYLSSFNPVKLFRGGTATGSKDVLRKSLLGLQFFISISILLCTVFIYKQLNIMLIADTGVDKSNILIIESGLWYDSQVFFDELKKNPNIVDATNAHDAPYKINYGKTNVKWDGSVENYSNVEIAHIFCDHNYANVFNLEVIQGKFIPAKLTWWQYANSESFNIVINESFRKLIGLENPIGTDVTYDQGFKGKIIGVVKDFNFKPLKEKTTPLLISFNPEACSKVFIKISGKNKEATLKFILDKYEKMGSGNQEAVYYWAEDDYQNLYKEELGIVKTLFLFTIISLTLSLMGIFNMVNFMLDKRRKELAIRKINGARIIDIMQLFIIDIGKVAVMATAIAIPVCYLLVKYWQQDYIYRTPLHWWLFLLIPLAVILITSILVGQQVYCIARQNPINSLRSE